MHILAKNSSGGLMHILKRIYDQLRKRGVNCLENDSFGSNALHYAVEAGCYDLCKILIEEKIDVNQINNLGFSPVAVLMKGKKGAE
jgi:ankyrin repeat protein